MKIAFIEKLLAPRRALTADDEAPDPAAAAEASVRSAASSMMSTGRRISLPPPHTSALEPQAAPLRYETLLRFLASTLTTWVLLVILLLLFLGSTWNPPAHYKNLRVAVLDADGGIIGKSLVAASASLPTTVKVLDCRQRGCADQDAVAQVSRGQFDMSLVATEGASAKLKRALHDATAVYDPGGAVAFAYDEGRSGLAMGPVMRAFAAQTVSITAARVRRSILASAAAANATVASLNACALAEPVGLRAAVLHPVPFAGENTAAGLAVIALWTATLAKTTVMLSIYDDWEDAGIRRDHQILARIAHELLSVCALALCLPAVLWALSTHCLGNAEAFFRIWAFLWLAMSVFGLAITALYRTFGPRVGSLVHSVFFILNVVSSTSVVPIELSNAFFRVGYALPFYNTVAGLRTLLFGASDDLPRNIGVLFAWLGALVLFALAKALRAARQIRLNAPISCTVEVVTGA